MRLLRALFPLTPVPLTFLSVFCVIILHFVALSFLEVTELKTYDLRLTSRAPRQPLPDIVLAVIDEHSLNTEGRWPWPRAKIAQLIDTLSQYGARVIGVDIGMLEPENNPQMAFVQQLIQQVAALNIEHPQLASLLQQSQAQTDGDTVLAQAIKNASAAIVLGYFFHMTEATPGHPMDRQEIEQQLQRIRTSQYPLVRYATAESRNASFLRAYAPESNIAILAEAAASSGYFSLQSDQDGEVRWMPLVIQGGEELFPPLAVLCAWHYLRKPPLSVHVGAYGVEGIQMGERFLPTDARGRLLINYLGPPQTFPHLSISDILSRKLSREVLQDKIVLIGATATGTYDARSTPVSPLYPGVEIHATLLDNILRRDFLTRPSWALLYDLGAIMLLGVLIALALPRLGALQGLCFTALLFALHILVVRWFFLTFQVWLNMVYPLLALAITYTLLTVYYYLHAEHERRRIKEAFSYYVPPKVVNELLQHPELLRLGGEERVLSVLFSDIEDFTSIAESMAPTQLVSLLNEYLSAMTDIVLQHDGIIDKYEGDAIMAEFGAPVMLQNHADMAVQAALLMQQRLEEMRQDWARRGLPLLRCRVGINTGAMVVGNMGSQRVFDYTVMGDAVNLASRLEGANKLYQTYVMISEFTYDSLSPGLFLTRLLDVIQVKGKSKAVKVFEVYGKASDIIADHAYYQTYHEAFEAYLARDFAAAAEQFQVALALRPQDVATTRMLQRLHDLEGVLLPEDWDGAVVLTSK